MGGYGNRDIITGPAWTTTSLFMYKKKNSFSEGGTCRTISYTKENNEVGEVGMSIDSVGGGAVGTVAFINSRGGDKEVSSIHTSDRRRYRSYRSYRSSTLQQ